MNKRDWPRAIAVSAVTILFVLPLFFMVAGALRRPGLAPPDGFEWIPSIRTWSNYSFASDIVPLGDYALNSLLVVVVAVPLTVLIASWAGFAIATAEQVTRKRLIFISVLALMVPLSARPARRHHQLSGELCAGLDRDRRRPAAGHVLFAPVRLQARVSATDGWDTRPR